MKHFSEKNSKKLWVNQVPITFTKKAITSWGGISSVVAKLLEVLEFRSWVEKEIPVIESSNNAKGIYEKVLATFLTVLCGGERFSHLSWWGHGVEAIKECFGVEWVPKASSSLTRFWGKINTQHLSEQVSSAARELAVAIIKWQNIDEETLNLDSSVLTRYGNQEGAKRGYNPKKRGRPSHNPIIAFLGSGHVVNLWNRSGDTSSGQGAADFYHQSRLALGNQFRVKRVLCDSGFYLIEFIEYLETEGHRYIIAVSISHAIQREILRINNWKKISKGIEVGEFHFEHADPKWTKPRRYVVVKQSINERPKALGKQPSLFEDLEDWSQYRFSVMVTNESDAKPEEVWRYYRPRANDENVIKDLKEGYGFENFNLKNFWSTEAVLTVIGLVFYNLIVYLNSAIINPNHQREHLKTLRYKYFIIPGLLGSGGRKKMLRLSVQEKSMRAKLISMLNRIKLIPHRLNCIAIE